MKKLLVWVVLLGVALGISSCDKGDDPAPAIVGTWSRVSYEYTGLPVTFDYWEGVTRTNFGEANYTLLIKRDGTYTRAFTLPSPYNLADKGEWTLDGTSFKLSPNETKDLDLIEEIGIPGTEFTLVGEVSGNRFKMSRVVRLGLASNADIDAADGDLDQIPEEKWVGVDVTLVYTFDKIE